jgi:hypothetical protein
MNISEILNQPTPSNFFNILDEPFKLDSLGEELCYSTEPNIYYDILTIPFTCPEVRNPHYIVDTLIGKSEINCDYFASNKLKSVNISIPLKTGAYKAQLVFENNGEIEVLSDCIINEEGKEYIINFPDMMDTLQRIVDAIENITK